MSAIDTNDYKPLHKSKTIIGLVITFVVSLAPLVGFSFSAEDGVFISEIVDSLFQTIGLGLAAYGRFTAEKKLKV